MGLGVGSIVSIGGGLGGGGGGSSSGITELNGQIGPTITIVGANGAEVSVPSSNVIVVDTAALSGLISTVPQSGVVGANGINVYQVDGSFVVDGAALSGLLTASGCYATSFGPTTSGRFEHNLGTRDVLVQIIDDSSPPRQVFPDSILYDTPNAISVFFNRPQSGRVVILSCGGSAGIGTGGTAERVQTELEFNEDFSNTYSEIIRVSGAISQIDIWDSALKSNKLYTKTITRVSGQISQVALTNEQTAATLVTDITRDASGVISSITRTFTT